MQNKNVSKIVMVNYLNSKPFEYGLHHYDTQEKFEIKAANPAQCAEQFSKGEADIALIPVGALDDLKDYKIITDYCIGCDGEVRTVCMLSNTPIELCQNLVLDHHSRTSYLLSQLILKEYFKIQLPICSADVLNHIPKQGDLILMIGDKVFDKEKDFLYNYDLGAIWKEMTNLPFVFAVWVAKMDVSQATEDILNKALSYGIQHLAEIISMESSENLDLYYYFHHNISYILDEDKKKALSLFLEKVQHNNEETKSPKLIKS